MKKFAVPYSPLIAPETYVAALRPYLDHVESVYFSMPSVLNSHVDLPYDQLCCELRKTPCEIKEMNDLNCRRLMELLKPLPVRTVLALNAIVYDMDPFSRKVFLQDAILPFVDEGLLDGIIVADLALGIDIHAYFPDIQLQVSCNAGVSTPRHMDLWHEKTGATYFNPVREAVRDLKMLKTLHATGYTIKVILNDFCLYGCPQYIAHPTSHFRNLENGFLLMCASVQPHNIFKINFVTPQNLHIVESYIDVLKIIGRTDPIVDPIIYRLDAYLNRRADADLLRLLPGHLVGVIRNLYGNELTIPVSEIPDKIVRCNCNCRKYCNDNDGCREAFTRILEKQGLEYRENPMARWRA